MDERKLAELFRTAADDVPPASFDVGDVVAESGRAAARRRTRAALGSALAAVLVFGGFFAYANVGTRQNGGVATSAGSAEGFPSPNLTPTPYAVPEPRDGEPVEPDVSGGLPPKSIPEDPSTQGDGTSGTTGRPPTAGGASGCQEVDRELAVALADELPAAEGLQPSSAAANCPPGARGAGYLVRDGDVHGVLSVVLVPPGVSALASTASAEAHAVASRGTVFVLSEPAQGAAVGPFEARLPELAGKIAARF
ncbi:hypothetical protein [Saccharothrix obliqua]|uniref:hypothetical protein n=1 Tax=Saccharothrix obliqua TaxID=2861747 RepID=UPI001C5DFF50|nr:hypothetical protein [Saccharothrix obliqua]MBW4715668.1 hypothetical protein [Saccharothrix obliqua]